VLAAFTNLESVIGATLQAKVGWLTNEVNILNTLIGAIAAVLLALAWQWSDLLMLRIAIEQQ